MDNMTLIMITIFVITATLVVTVLNIMQRQKNKRLKKTLEKLEIEKNEIDCNPIAPELSKIECYLKNEKMEKMYCDWQCRLDNIKKNDIPKITDMLLEADYSLSKLDYKAAICKIAKLEMELYKTKTNSEQLLNEIKEITTSEEKNRAIITKLKAKYRELLQRFNDNKKDYGEIADPITLQFENIAKRFEVFEVSMENNEYTEITQLIKSIDEMLKHMTVVLDEVPSILLLTNTVLPKKMKEVKETYERMTKQNYPLDYLNIEYNIEEANKKITDILDRCRVLNLEDSLFELKVLMDYFESVFVDFEKEKVNRDAYEDANNIFKGKLKKLNDLINEIFSQIDDLRNLYNLSDENLNLLNNIREEINVLNTDYNILVNHTNNNTFAYSKLTKELENLSVRLSAIEESLDSSLNTIGNMRDDEMRARQQLEEIKLILKDAKAQMRDYNLPVVPRSYYVELNEASSAIREIVKELEKKPITIGVLNTRVDTARDLVLKLYGRTKEMLKTAMFAEMAIVYGNRYRTSVDELDKNLTYSEILFCKGEYQKSLELTINCLNRVEPGIYEKLLKIYSK